MRLIAIECFDLDNLEREDGDPDSDEENYNGEESCGIFFSLPFGNSL